LQRWLWEQGWSGLRDAQLAALPLILDGRSDLVISAATAAGKTEAAFLPLLTRLWQNEGRGIVLYVAPMKALINDQQERLSLICARLEIPVFPWHGDIGQTLRRRFMADPHGLLLITPESLESLLFRRGTDLKRVFGALEAVVVDELHAFIGNERGRQLQSLLHRLECLLGRRVQRIGLSATLGDRRLAADFLRVGDGEAVDWVASRSEKKSLQLRLKAVLEPASVAGADANYQAAHTLIATELATRLRGANYLVFPNSTGMVEFYADALRQHCEAAGLPVTFFPHHGRLGKSEREVTEQSLKRGALPVSAICTTTLEMGIDIGAIRGVVQIGAPDSVSSLCQRIGRAGRRGDEAAVLWQYCVLPAAAPGDNCVSPLYAELLQSIAVIQLYLAKWTEPSPSAALHYSTLVQQVLSLIGERQGLTAADAYQTLCRSGPFRTVNEADFIALLRALAASDLIVQDVNRLLLHGGLGEKRVNHFTFFAAFPDAQEYRLRHAGKELGTLPLDRTRTEGEVLIFAGRRWRIASIEHDKKRVDLLPARVGRLPRTGGSGQPVHDRIRAEMRALLAGEATPLWLDATASALLHAARRHYRDLGLAQDRDRDRDANALVCEGTTIHLFLWRGDRVNEALVALLRSRGLHAENLGICLQITRSSEQQVTETLAEIAAAPCPRPADVLVRKSLGDPEKWDWVLPDALFYASFASSRLSLDEAHALCGRLGPPLDGAANI
jgi:ATP-dependent Lhr-like helicase